MEIIGYILISIVVIVWIIVVFFGMVNAYPYGIIGLIAFAGIGVLFIKVLKDKLASAEDKHYSDNIEK